MKTTIFFFAVSIQAVLAQTQVFVIAGQSNADGGGNRTQLTPVPTWAQNSANGWTGAPTASSDSGTQYQHPTAQNAPMLYISNNSGLSSRWANAWCSYEGSTPNFPYPDFVYDGNCTEASSFGPELSFLAKYQADHPTAHVAVIKVVLGGSGIQDWLPGGSMEPVWKGAIQQAQSRLAGTSYQWAGLLWMQGENGASDVYKYLHPTVGDEYSDQLRIFLSNFRGATSPTLPIVIGRIGTQMLADNIINACVQTDPRFTAQQYRDATNYRRAQQVLVGGDPGNSWVDTDNLPINTADAPAYQYHFTGAGYLAMGERFYYAFAHQPPPPPPLPTTLNSSLFIGGVSTPIDLTTAIMFVSNPDGSLRPVITRGGIAVPRTTTFNLSLSATQQ